MNDEPVYNKPAFFFALIRQIPANNKPTPALIHFH